MRAILFSVLLLSCSSAETPPAPTSALSPVSAPASSQASVVAPAPHLDLSGEFTITFQETAALDPIDETLIIRSDGSIELQERVEQTKKALKRYPPPGKISKAMLSPAELDSIRFSFSSPDFYALKDSYREKMWDVPSYSFSIKTPTQEKTISLSGTLLGKTPTVLQTAIVYARTVTRDRLNAANPKTK